MDRQQVRNKQWWEKFWRDLSKNYGPPNKVLLKFAAEFINGRQNLNAVDISSGNGRYAIPLAKLGYKVDAIELTNAGAQRILDFSKKEDVNVNVKEGDFAELSKERKQYDLVFCSGLLEEIKKEYQRNIIQGLMNWTKPQGMNIVKYCLEIKKRGQLVEEDLVPVLYKKANWKILFSEKEQQMHKSRTTIRIRGRIVDSEIRTETVVAIKPIRNRY